ncbi:MAG: four-carbon acid sugar kinase family protein [Tepidisphaeraceae bacterium]
MSERITQPRLAFVGDDFTGSTDALESLALAGAKATLFTYTPTAEDLAARPGLHAFGIATMTRSLPPPAMESVLRSLYSALEALRVPIVHYKVCSTFDSSTTTGSIGRAIDVGLNIFGSRPVPIVAGTPAIGRYCVFGNLFARHGSQSWPFRIDRHPSMCRHPITPMSEADLRVHIGKQTTEAIGLLDLFALRRGDTLPFDSETVQLIDTLEDADVDHVGTLLADLRSRLLPARSMYVVGSSTVETAVGRSWNLPHAELPAAQKAAGPIIAVCGSCSPATTSQIRYAQQRGFEVMSGRPGRIDTQGLMRCVAALREGRSVVLHSDADRRLEPELAAQLNPTLASLTVEMVSEVTGIRRILLAGGDTSGQVAHALGVRSIEVEARLVRGVPLCRVTSQHAAINGIEMAFKGGQMGGEDFFCVVRDGIH